MSSFAKSVRKIAQYRVCLERDVGVGIIPADAADAVDTCYRTLVAALEAARVEFEGAGPEVDADGAFRGHFVGGCSSMALTMFRAMYRQRDPRVLGETAGELRSEAQHLMGHLWARLENAA